MTERTRGETTRTEILDRAVAHARRVGLSGVTIGQLATDLGLSKSGLFAHFGSRDALEAAIVDHAAAEFADRVVRPALTRPRGEARLTAAFEAWLAWGAAAGEGGCLFVGAAAELDDRPGPARDRLVAAQRDWLDSLAQIVRSGIADGAFRSEASPEQVAFELYGIMLSTHLALRLLGDPNGLERARVAYRAIVDRLRS